MELLAVIVGLEALKKSAEVIVTSDSKYVCDAFNNNWIDGWVKKNWKNVKNEELWKRLLKAMKEHEVKFNWVKGHAGHPYNERCDKLAVNAYKQDNLLECI
jgi:ribonuclease HI